MPNFGKIDTVRATTLNGPRFQKSLRISFQELMLMTLVTPPAAMSTLLLAPMRHGLGLGMTVLKMT